MARTVNPELIQKCKDSENRVEFTHAGHEFALANDYDSTMTRLQCEAEPLISTGALEFSCANYPITEEDFGAAMPPVVSWLHQSGPEDNRRQDRFLLHLLPDQACFQGHFPGGPILPGIIQLHWAVRMAQTCLGFSGQPREILRLKYHNIAVPPRFIELDLECSENPGVQFRVHSQDLVHAQGRLVFDGSV